MNPLLPIRHFVPDTEARVMPDCRLYLYGSYDISRETTYCSDILHVFSTDDLVHWTDHGAALRSQDIPWASEGHLLYAPDCIYQDGTYYLYFCMTGSYEGVAISDSPAGPFHHPVPITPADRDSIDPAVFIDTDGQAYYFWGQFHLRGSKLNPDMITLDVSTLNTCIIDEKNHGFHEGISIRKRNGIYYLLYTDISRGKATCISYAMSDSPLGPYKKGGVIIDNINCDPNTWNNHGCMAEYKGQWYVFYHRSSQNSKFNRRVCIEPIFFDERGYIAEVPMTSQGAEPPLSAGVPISAALACQMMHGLFISPAADNTTEILSHATNGSWAAYRYLSFDAPKSFSITAAAAINGGTVEIWADSLLLGSCLVTPTGGWDIYRTFRCPLTPVTGVKTLYLVFRGNDLKRRLMDVKEFCFYGDCGSGNAD